MLAAIYLSKTASELVDLRKPLRRGSLCDENNAR